MRTKKLNVNIDSFLNSNELLNFGKSIEESSRLALKKVNSKKQINIEESTEIKVKHTSAKFDPDFIFKAADKAKKHMKIEEAKTFLSTDKYSEDKLKEKYKIDLPYLKSLEENFKFEETKITYNKILEEALVIAADLYKEANCTPRLASLALDKTLTESEVNKIFDNKFKNSLEENFRLKLLNGTLLEENMEPVKKIIKISVDKGLGDDVGEIDPAKMGTVLGFNNVLSDHLKDVILPEGAQNKIDSFINAQDGDYNNVPGNANELLQKLTQKIDDLTTLLSGSEFAKNVDTDEDIDAGKYSAVAKVCSMADGENQPNCSETIEVDDDKDNDGKSDDEEDHGVLPDDFKGDHEDAEEQTVKDDITDAAEIVNDDADGQNDVNTDDDKDNDDEDSEAEEIVKDLKDDEEANLDDQVMDSLELSDGEDVAADDIKKADAEITPEDTEDKELIETTKK